MTNPNTFDLLLAFADAVSFVPMHLSLSYLTILEQNVSAWASDLFRICVPGTSTRESNA